MQFPSMGERKGKVSAFVELEWPIMKIISWNVNSIRLRIHLIEKMVREDAPDVICLQETKVEDKNFPLEPLQRLGFDHIELFGMKAYHGVAVLSRVPLANHRKYHWCNIADARHQSVELPNGVDLHNIYLPAGGNEPDPKTNKKFDHKLRFFNEQAAWWSAQDIGQKRILLGDLNVAPLETDVWSHKQLLKVVSHTPIEVEHFGRMQQAHGWVDAVRAKIDPDEPLFSWWSYRARDWRASNRGRRLDHIWVTPSLAPAVKDARVLVDARGWEKPSDHAPVLLELNR